MTEEELKEIWKIQDIIRDNSNKKKDKRSNISIIAKNGVSYNFMHNRKLLKDVLIDNRRLQLFQLIKLIDPFNIASIWDNITEERIY